MIIKTSKPALAVDPEIHRFDSNSQKALKAKLSEINNHTVCAPIEDPSDIKLDETGKTRRGGLRFSTLAISQLGQVLAPGLSKILFSVSGFNKDKGLDSSMYSLPVAVKLANDLFSLRFELLKDKFLVRNTKTATIDGITGSSYFYLANQEFYDKLNDAIADSPTRLRFDNAMICGRRLVVNYSKTDSLCKLDNVEYRSGYTFTNAETGDCSVKMNPSLVGIEDDRYYTCLRAEKRRRLVHIGYSLDVKLLRAFDLMLSSEDNPYKLNSDDHIKQTLLPNLLSTNLKLGDLKAADHKTRINRMVSILRLLGLTQRLARRIVYLTVYRSKKESLDFSSANLRMNDWGDRTVYDLFITLLREGEKLPVPIKEAVEIIAFKILSGKVAIVR